MHMMVVLKNNLKFPLFNLIFKFLVKNNFFYKNCFFLITKKNNYKFENTTNLNLKFTTMPETIREKHNRYTENTLAIQYRLPDEFTLRDFLKEAKIQLSHAQRKEFGREIVNIYKTGTKKQNGDSYPLSLYHKRMYAYDEGEISDTIYEFFRIMDLIK